MIMTPQEFLLQLRLRGATRLSRVSFRRNRSTLWSLTQNARVLNVHAAYAAAPTELLEAFAVLAREGGVRSAATRRAASAIAAWPEAQWALRNARVARENGPSTGCCATPEQARYLRALYQYLNLTRFAGGLPDDLPVRLSGRMVSALGHMLPADGVDGRRRVAEIALSVDLMLEGNGAERIDTLLHEMAHAADYLESGHRGHGASWRSWARRVGCRPTRLHERPFRRRRRRRAPVTRVPPLPASVSSLVDQAGQSHPNAPAVSAA